MLNNYSNDKLKKKKIDLDFKWCNFLGRHSTFFSRNLLIIPYLFSNDELSCEHTLAKLIRKIKSIL